MMFVHQADLRHVGQGHEIVIELPTGTLAERDLGRDVKARFYEATKPCTAMPTAISSSRS